MAYEMVMPYHLHMPSYFLETFTEYPTVNEEFGFEASPRLDWGGTASVGIAVKRISFTVGYDLAWGKYNKEQNDLRIRNHMVSFTSGYSF